jgi:uncharacterized protein (TIGR02996 family)
VDATELSLLAGICAEPADDTARLVFADFLDEQGRRERAEFIRAQVALARKDWSRCSQGHPWERVCKGSYPVPVAICRACGMDGPFWPDVEGDIQLRAREKALFGHTGTAGFFDTLPGAYRNADSRMQITTADQLKYTVRRGFVEALECSAANFLKHADALVWNPEQKAKCSRCDGDGKAHGSDRPFEWSADVDYGKCVVCKGTGYSNEPRPCVETAQPVAKVKLTTHPNMQSNDEGWRIRGESLFDGPFLPRVRTKTPMNGDWRDALPELFAAYWPGVEFELPPRLYFDDVVGGGDPPVPLPEVEYVAAGDGFLPAEGWLIEPITDEFDTLDFRTGKRGRDAAAGERQYSLSLTYPPGDGFASALPRRGDTFGPVAAMTLSRQATITVARAIVESVESIAHRLSTDVRVRARVVGDVNAAHPA